MRRWTLSRRITALCAVVAFVLCAIAISATAVAAGNRTQMSDVLGRVAPMRTDSVALLAALVDQETGVRGYASSGNPDFLQPYQQGLAQERKLVQKIRTNAHDTTVLARLADVESQMDAWRSQVAAPTIAAARAGAPAASTPAVQASAKSRFDRIRASVASLQDAVASIRDASSGRLQRGQDVLVALLVLAGVVIVVAGVALAVLLRQLVTRPVVELAAEVRRVARGEYDLEIASDGPPEVALLASDVNAMREQIVADLATVRRARLHMEDANKLLEQQAEDLTRSNRDLEQFAYVASHDLQEPLRKVASFCQLLQRRYAGQLDERADQYILFAVDGAQRMQRLINDLLAFSRIGRITTGFVDVDLDRVVSDVAAQLEGRREQVGGEITWSGLPTVRGEEPLLTALFTNLISNSLKFRHADRPVRVHIDARQIGDEWEICCADNGIGIEPEYADKIFVIFQRLHPKDQYPGTGIGLAIAKKIIEYHGGRIWLDADHRDGTLLRFTLPVTKFEPEAPAWPVAEPAAQVPIEPAPALIPSPADASRAEEPAT